MAPEHVSAEVLQYMRKPPRAVTLNFFERYAEMNARLGMKQFSSPISCRPIGSTLKEAVELAEFIATAACAQSEGRTSPDARFALHLSIIPA